MSSWKKVLTSGDANSTGSNASLNFLSIGHYVNPASSTFKLDVSGSGIFRASSGEAAVIVETSNVLGSFSAVENEGLFIKSDKTLPNDPNNINVTVDATLALYITGSNGYVGINTDDPTHNFRVSGSLRVDNPGTSPGNVGGQPPPDIVEGGIAAQGNPNTYLGKPDKWLTINIDGIDYTFPGYLRP